MSQTANQAPHQPPKESPKWLETAGKLLTMLKRNWPTKLLSLALAMALWAGLITQDPTLTREKTFRDVSVTVSGTDTLKRYGFTVVTDLDALLDGVTVVADVPQKQYVNAQASNYNIRLDLSRIREAGEQEVAISATSSSTYGSVVRITPARVKVVVEEYVSVGYIPVNAVISGTAPEGFHVGSIACDPAWLTVSGPRSVVEQVERAEVTVALDKLPAREGEVRKAADFRLLGSDGQLIEDDTLQVTSDTVLRTNVNVTVQLLTRRDVDMTAETLTYGRPAPGYEVAGIIVSPPTVSIAGERSIVETARLVNNRRAVNIAGAKETVEAVIDLGTQPNLAWVSAAQLEVSVIIQPIREARRFPEAPIEVTGAAAGMTATPDRQTAAAQITGASAWVKALPEDGVRLLCDVSGLGPGVHDVPLQVSADGADGQEFTADAEPMTIRVTIAEKE